MPVQCENLCTCPRGGRPGAEAGRTERRWGSGRGQRSGTGRGNACLGVCGMSDSSRGGPAGGGHCRDGMARAKAPGAWEHLISLRTVELKSEARGRRGPRPVGGVSWAAAGRVARTYPRVRFPQCHTALSTVTYRETSPTTPTETRLPGHGRTFPTKATSKTRTVTRHCLESVLSARARARGPVGLRQRLPVWGVQLRGAV